MAEDPDPRTRIERRATSDVRGERPLAGPRVPITGRLIRHGAAPYQFRPGAEHSYFVELLVVGERKRIWGKDLGRALSEAETKPKIGDLVGAQRMSRRAVTITRRQLDSNGRVIAQVERQAHRNEWRIEKVQYFSARAREARRARDQQQDRAKALAEHPELKSTFLTMRAAAALAERRIADPAERQRFLKVVQEAINVSVNRGEPLPEVRLRDRTAHAPASVPRARKPDDPVR